jgi:AraC-like DNA-binding protein
MDKVRKPGGKMDYIFTKQFKKLEDMSPYSYRKLYGRVHVNLYHQERI